MLYGLLQPDGGSILWQGTAVTIPEPRAARRLGVGMVFQHFSLFEAMTVAENVALGLDDAPNDTRKLVQPICDVPAASGLPLDHNGRADRGERVGQYGSCTGGAC